MTPSCSKQAELLPVLLPIGSYVGLLHRTVTVRLKVAFPEMKVCRKCSRKIPWQDLIAARWKDIETAFKIKHAAPESPAKTACTFERLPG